MPSVEAAAAVASGLDLGRYSLRGGIASRDTVFDVPLEQREPLLPKLRVLRVVTSSSTSLWDVAYENEENDVVGNERRTDDL